MTRQSSVSLLKAIALIGIYGGLLMPLVFIPVVIFPFVFSKLIVFQVLIGLTFPAYLLLAWMDPYYRPKSHLLYSAICAYFVALALSVMFAVDPQRAWWGNQERMNGLFTLLHFLAWLTMAVGVLKTWNQWKRLLQYEAVLSGIMAIVALLQKVKPDLLIFPAGDRVGGLLDNPIYMGTYQIFNLFFLALLALRATSKKSYLWYGLIGLLDIGAFVMAESRGDLAGLGVGIICFAVWYAFFSKSKKARIGILSAVGALFIAYGVLFAFRDTSLVVNSSFGRFVNFSSAVSTRLIAWNIAWQGFLERPLTGWGLDNFHILFNQKYNPQSLRFSSYETWFDRAHNTVLDVLSMTGLFGFLTFIGIFAALFVMVWRAYKKGWIDLPTSAVLFALPIAYFVQNLFVFDHPAAFSMSYLLFGLVIAATRPSFLGSEPVATTEKNTSHNFSWAAFGVLYLLAALLVWRTSVLPFKASYLSLQANSYFMTQSGYDRALAASQIPTMYLDEQTFLLSRNLITIASNGQFKQYPKKDQMYALAKSLLDRELARHPRNTNTLLIYARLLHEMAVYYQGDAILAEKEYLAAIDTSPQRQQLWYGLAQLYVQEGRKNEATDIYRKIVGFDPDFGESHWMYGLSLYYDHGDLQNGAKEMIAAINAPYPYHIREARELIPLADAYLVLKDMDHFKGLVDLIATTPVTQPSFYAQLAQKYDQNKLPELRDRVLNEAEKLVPGVKDAYAKLGQGTVGTNVLSAPKAPVTNQVTTSTSGGTGPRR